MNDLNTLLDRAAGDPDRGDVGADLSRGHRALARTRRRRGAVGLAGVAAAGVLGVALTRDGNRYEPTRAADEPTASPSSTPETPPPSAAPSFFELPPNPSGWEIQGSSPFGVTFARPGDTTSPDDFEGKIVLMFDGNSPAGAVRELDGRKVYVDPGRGGEYTTVSTRSEPDQPAGMLVLQFPPDVLSVDDAVAFVTGVRVLPGAAAGLG